MQRSLLILVSAFTILSCSRSNPVSPQPIPIIDSTPLLSPEYLVSTYVTIPGPDVPEDVAVSPDGTIYVCGPLGSIWKIQPDSTPALVTSLTGRTTELAFDPKGNIYLLNFDSKSIIRVTPAGVVTTFAGGAHQLLDGQGTAAGFSILLNDLVIDTTGTIYVADSNTIRKVDPSGLVTTLYRNTAPNSQISAITLDRAHNIYYATLNQIWRLDAAGTNSFIAGDGGQISKDGSGIAAGFQGIWALQVDNNGNLIAGDFSEVRLITPSGVAGTIAGNVLAGYVDGPGNLARLRYVVGLAIDPRGAILAADVANGRIRKIVHK
ncbi:MAG TPA: hypothetical protein VNW04_01060 [Puia sp.]|nr:hypothetical protein [Puia sp.]